MIITTIQGEKYWMGKQAVFTSHFPGYLQLIAPSKRTKEEHIYGALFNHAETEVSGVTFYPPELEPNVTSASCWAVVSMDMTDKPTREKEWMADGLLRITVNCRKTNNIYSAMDVANDLSTAFGNQYVEVTYDSNRVGHVMFYGTEADNIPPEKAGVISAMWEARFRALSSREQ